MKKNLALTIFVSVVGAVFVGGVLWATTKVVYRDRKIEKEIEDLKQQENAITTENRSLRDKIAFQQTPGAQELYAKQKLDLQKQDENVVVVKPGAAVANNSTAAVQPEQLQTQAQSNVKKWWNYFFGYKQ